MPTILANNLSFQLDTGEWLFKGITFSLSSRLTKRSRKKWGWKVITTFVIGQENTTHIRQCFQTRLDRLFTPSYLQSSWIVQSALLTSWGSPKS